ncbi:hypothetical protein BHAMNSH16_13535 [Brachyspira hampsonii]|uniref:Cyclophilin-like domain-containing protein n=2 Tax=Brachyspira hampsonii TaxID=1287055 RepID=A0AAC9TWF0_9SPIR|nr:cyclophilin-like fold protein [Brachyspira hampsonii]ASJ22609.1 hypothetical protein BHAMNSH16_13535 [Brachyspira hampsonii]OEJ19304.1 hypothetical protein A9496_04290 [Brachyspira hampsonii]
MKIKKYFFSLLIFSIISSISCYSVYGDNTTMENLNVLNTSVNVKIKDKEYKLKLYDNQTAKDFLALLPLTVNMNELNSNEKYYNLSKKLTTKTENIGSIKTGDFLLYGNNCIVLFYESFRTSYSYTRLGYIENTEGLKEALGRGSIEITFSVASEN